MKQKLGKLKEGIYLVTDPKNLDLEPEMYWWTDTMGIVSLGRKGTHFVRDAGYTIKKELTTESGEFVLISALDDNRFGLPAKDENNLFVFRTDKEINVSVTDKVAYIGKFRITAEQESR